MRHLIGIDIGGTSVKLGLIQCGEAFRVLGQSSLPTFSDRPAMLLVQRIAEAVGELVCAAGSPVIDGAGVGCPGLIDPAAGMVRISGNLPNLLGFPLRDELARRLGLGVEIQNDANAAVLGEWLFSPASQNARNLCLLTLGTGVGGGVICDGHLLMGADNAATELGHLKVEYTGGALCSCGRHGCLEAYAGAAGIARMAREILASGASSVLKADSLSTKGITEAARAGDVVAVEVLRRVGRYLGRGIAMLIDAFNPEAVVLGGGASAAMEFFRPGIQAALIEYASFAFTRDRCTIERSAFPDDINVIGAAATYLNAHR